jgi:hypothetical protein
MAPDRPWTIWSSAGLPRSGPSCTRDRTIDEIRLNLDEGSIAEAGPIHHAGPKFSTSASAVATRRRNENSQLVAAERAGEDVGEVQDPRAFKKVRHHPHL